MRWLVLTAILAAAGLTGALIEDTSHCRLTLELVDARTGEPLPGVVQLATSEGQAVGLKELIHRGQGLGEKAPISRWWVLPSRATVEVPATKLKLQALAGLETELAAVDLDLEGKREHVLKVPLVRFYQPRPQGYVAGNTHLHLRKLSKEQAD